MTPRALLAVVTLSLAACTVASMRYLILAAGMGRRLGAAGAGLPKCLIEVNGESGAGLVKVVMTCKHDVKRVTIDPSLLADDKDMLEDLVAAAFNAAVRKAEETTQEKMGKLTAGLPPGMKLPF